MNISNPQSFNRYAYVDNDPVNFIDPSGLLKAAPYNGGHLGDVTVVGHYDPSISHNGGSVWDYAYSDHWGTSPYDTYLPETDPGDPFGLGDLGEPQKPEPPDRRTEPQRKCDNKLSSIFGGVAAGSGYEPTGLPSVGGSYRGGPTGHLNNAAHIYGSANGFGEADLYIPAGGTYIGKNPRSKEDSYMFYYSELGSARDVTLVTSHVANFSAPRGETTGRTNIGDIGGRGGRSMSTVGVQNPSGRGTNIHAHLAILKGHGWETGKRLSFSDVFCK